MFRPFVIRRAPGLCSRRSLRHAFRQSEHGGLGHAHDQPPNADDVAFRRAAHSCSDAFTTTPAPATPSPTVAPAAARDDAHHHDRSCVLPDAGWQRRRGRQRANARSGPPDGAQEHGDGNGRDEGAARGTIGQGASGECRRSRRSSPPARSSSGSRSREASRRSTCPPSSPRYPLTTRWDLGMFSLRGRLAQVVYTLTQFTTVDRVNFKLEGKPVKVLFGMPDPEDGSSEAIAWTSPSPGRRTATATCR